MTGQRPRNQIKLAPQQDYDLIAKVLECSPTPSMARCKLHNGVWVVNRCMIANAIANRLGSKILASERKITELMHRPNASAVVELKREARAEGFQEAIRVLGGATTVGRARVQLQNYFRKTYGTPQK